MQYIFSLAAPLANPCTDRLLLHLLFPPSFKNIIIMSAGKQVFRFGITDGIDTLLKRNAEWAKNIGAANPSLFPAIGNGQSPQILWIGCADSRISDRCVDLLPGEVFVHRNIANMVPHNDMSSLAILQLAVDSLKVRHIIVCGHTNCKGVEVSLTTARTGGELDGWLRNLREVRAKHLAELNKISDFRARCDKLTEFNVAEQVRNVKRNDRVAAAIKERGLEVHGLVFDVATGLLKQIPVSFDPTEEEAFICHD